MEETVALYSENNTPYKLRPASQDTINSIKTSILTIQHNNDKECMVCRDDMEIGCEIIELPSCSHCFHKECIIRWLQMQGTIIISIIIIIIITINIIIIINIIINIIYRMVPYL